MYTHTHVHMKHMSHMGNTLVLCLACGKHLVIFFWIKLIDLNMHISIIISY